MDLIGIVARLRALEATVKQLLCGNENKEIDPTVPQYVKDLKKEQVATLVTAVDTELGSWI